MSAADIEALCAAARQRLAYFIARKTAQQLRRMRESWGAK
jgi:hypothetical protein